MFIYLLSLTTIPISSFFLFSFQICFSPFLRDVAVPIENTPISIPDFLIRHYFHLEGVENIPRTSATAVTGEEHS